MLGVVTVAQAAERGERQQRVEECQLERDAQQRVAQGARQGGVVVLGNFLVRVGSGEGQSDRGAVDEELAAARGEVAHALEEFPPVELPQRNR